MKLRLLVLMLGAATLAVVPGFAMDEPENTPEGIYNATIGAVQQHVVCDDYLASISWGRTWMADVIRIADLNPAKVTNTMFGDRIGFNGNLGFGHLPQSLKEVGSVANSGRQQIGAMAFRVPEGGSALLFLLLAGGACLGAMRLRPQN